MSEYREHILLDGQYNFSELVDLDRFTALFNKYNASSGFSVGLVDNNSLEDLLKTEQKKICGNFLCPDEEARRECRKKVFTDLDNEESMKTVECSHGLSICIVPVIIEEKHIASLTTEPLLFNETGKNGFDENEYFEALKAVPVVTRQQVKKAMEYLLEFSVYIAEQGLNTLRLRRLNEELAKKEENLNLFKISVEQSPEAVYWIDEQANYIYVNHYATEMLGYTKQELLKMGVFDMDPVYTKEEWASNWEKRKNKKIPPDLKIETIHERKDGSRIETELISNYVKLDDKEYIITHVRDITERKRVEEIIRRSEAKYRLLFENMPSSFGIYKMIYDTDGEAVDYEFIETNPVHEADTGFKSSELIGKTVKQVFPETEDYWIKLFGEVARTGKSKHYINYAEAIGQYFEAYAFSSEKDYCAVVVNNITERVKDEQSLNMFKISSESSMEAVYWFTPRGDFIYVNKSACEMLGYSEAELLSMRVFDIDPFYPEDEWDRQWEIFRKDNKERKLHLETIHKTKDGVFLYIDIVTTFIIINGTEYQIAHGRDITDKKIKEIELNKFKMSIDNSMDGVYWLNENGGFDYVNDQACNMLGYTRDELLQLKISDIDEFYTLEFHKNTWADLSRNKTISKNKLESEQKKKDGTYIPVEVNAIFIWIDKKGFMITYVTDISERKEHEAIILKNQKLLRDSQRSAHQGSYEIDIREGAMNLQDEAYSIFGYEKGELDLTVKNFLELVHPEDADYVVEMYRKTISEKKFISHEYRILRKDGEVRNLQIVGDLEFDNTGEPIRAFGIMQDITERKKAELAIKQSEEKYRLLFENIPSGFSLHEMIYDEEGNPVDYRFLEMNPVYEKELSVTASDLVGKTMREIGAESDQHLIQLFGKVADTGIPENRSLYVEELNKHFEYFVFSPKKGQFAVVSNDITDRLNAENDFKELANLNQVILETVSLGLIFVRDRKIIWVNDAILNMFGYSQDELIGQSTLIFYADEEHYRKIGAEAYDVLISGDTFFMESPGKHKNGSVFWCQLASKAVNPDNLGEGSLWTILDIDESKQHEEQLRIEKEKAEDSEKRLKALQNASFGGIAIHDKGIILDCNKSLSDMTGYTYDELIGMNGLLLIAESTRDFVTSQIQKGYEKPYEALGVRKNGQEYPIRLEARIIPFKGKQVRSVEFRDITDIKQAEQELVRLNNELESRVNQRTEQLQLANEELKSTLKHLKETQTQLLHSEKMASLGILTAGVAHEINNPLNYISGAYSGLQAYFENKSFSENYEEVGILIDAIKTGVERSTAIVKGLNQFSRNSESLNEDCDIHAIMENSLSMLQNQIKHRIIIEKQYCSDKLLIRGNVGHLHQVFLNIFGNAVQAIPQEGLIKIETESILDKISIEITDNGMGISSENLEKVTDPFFSTKDAGEGTGLGLAITYNIIREHKGEMEFKSEVGKGTTVKIILPKNRKE